MGDGLKASALFLMSIGVLFFAGEFPGFWQLVHLVGSPLKKQQPLPLGSFAAVPGIGPVRQIPALVGAWLWLVV